MSKILLACEDCGLKRLVLVVRGIPKHKVCKRCQLKYFWGNNRQRVGENHPNWKGGIVKGNNGYIRVKLYPNDFFYLMANKQGYVLEHRLVVAKALGRCLLPWEVVHHKEGYAKDDNRYPETLQLITDKRFHLIDAEFKAYVKRLEKRIVVLESELALLQSQLQLEWGAKIRGM